MFTDSETGEHVSSILSPNIIDPFSKKTTPQQIEYNLETGEQESRQIVPTIRKRKTRFSVPRVLLAKPEETKHCCIDPDENYTLSGKDQVITLQEDIIHGFNKTSHRLFVILITTLYLLTHHVVVVGVLLEFAMHAWAHYKNFSNTNPEIYYRSPLHVFTAQFCASCRRETAMNQVIKMQDQRMKLWQLNLKDVARTIY